MNGPLEGAWALVPVKRLDHAKTRLAPVLGPEARRRLQLGLLADVLAALSCARRLRGVAVITADPTVAAAARSAGCYLLREARSTGLDRAVAGGAAALAAAGADMVAAIPADTPLIDPAEIDRMLMLAAATGDVVAVSDARGDGTNALVFPAGRPPVFAYGPGSFARHSGGPKAVGLTLPSLALDIDMPEDLDALLGDHGAQQSRAAIDAPTRNYQEAP